MFSSTQLLALSELYNVTNGKKWFYGSCAFGKVAWNFTGVEINPCLEQWCGITCIADQTSIRVLSLSEYGLKGRLPQSIDHFVDLEILDLSSNKLSGKIPSSLKNLTKLNLLDLYDNKLTGSIPCIFSNQSILMQLILTLNQLEGTVPASFKELQHISIVSLSSNKLWGNLLDWLSPFQLSHISQLGGSSNLFSGTFPVVTNLTNLIYLDLSDNNFHGSLPDIFYHSNGFEFLFISNNHFTGILPLFPPSIFDIDVDNNQFTGRIDHINWMNTNMTQLSTTSNYFTGPFPLSLCSLKTATFINLGFNYLAGSLAIKTCQQYLYTTVYELTLQGNFFTGSLNEIFNSSQKHEMIALALSNNDFTGSISGKFFQSALTLGFYSIGSNCLSGTLPNEICNLVDLQGFSMDGASTSERCRRQIVDLPSVGLSAFLSFKQIAGTIPSCLFELPILISLYLSGNGFTGTLPSSVSFADSMYFKNISLSYNRLTGTIPMSWYNHKWDLLDLSYNKLIGSLPEASEEFDNVKTVSSTISLQVNRLSGIIPPDMTSFPGSITILKGNMFSCNFFKEELPKNDLDSDTYVCGSNMVNTSIYLWLIVGISLLSFAAGIVGIRKISYRRSDEKRLDVLRRTNQLVYRVWKNFFIDNSSDLPEAIVMSSSRYPFTFNFFSFTLHTRQYALLMLCFMMVVLLPVYALLGIFYRTYDERYAWTISAAFLSGTDATITLMVFFVLFIVLSVFLVHCLFRETVKEYYNRHVYCLKSWHNWRVIALWTIAWMINGIIMITADSLYVSLIINRSTKFEYLIQITIAIFKLLWHDIGIFQMIHLLKKFFAPNAHVEDQWKHLFSSENNYDDTLTHPMLILSHNNEEEEAPISITSSSLPSDFDSSLLTTQDIRYLTYMSIVNKVMIPCLAIFFISSSCFYNALVSEKPPPAYYFICYNSFDCINLLGSSVSFTPAFNYSYQCSSAFLTDYVPVFVFMLIASSVLLPALTFIMTILYERLKERRSTSRCNELALRVVKSFLPFGWGGVERDQIEFRRRAQAMILHRKQLLTLRISYTSSVMFVFGSLFPPLALIATIAIINITMLEEYLTKAMLRQSCLLSSDEDLSSSDYVNYLEKECEDVERNVFKVMKLIVYLTCGLFGFVLFDVCGDRNGWSEGMVPMVLMILFPFVLYPIIAWRTKEKSIDRDRRSRDVM